MIYLGHPTSYCADPHILTLSILSNSSPEKAKFEVFITPFAGSFNLFWKESIDGFF